MVVQIVIVAIVAVLFLVRLTFTLHNRPGNRDN
jgi:hypothetical protein